MKPAILKAKLGKARADKRSLLLARNSEIDKIEKLMNKKAPQKAIDKKQETIDEITEGVQKLDKKINDYTDKVLDMNINPNFDEGTPNGIFGGSDSSKKGVEQWEAVSEDKKRPINVLSPKASLKGIHKNESKHSDLATYLRGRVRGYTNSMDSGADSALVPQPLSDEIIDLARNKTRVIQAGARTVAMDSKTLTIAKQTDDPSVDWKKENASHTPSDVSFDPLTFTAKTLIGSVKSSVELAEDAGNLATLVRNSLASQIALKLDKAALSGSGTGAEPTGVINTDNVQMETLGSGNGDTLDGYGEFSKAYQNILAKNGTPNAVIYSPRTWGVMDRLTDDNGQPLNAPQSYQNLTKYQTEQVPTDLTLGSAENSTFAIVADWRKLLIGVRSQIRLEVTRVGSDSDSSAWEDLQLSWRAYARYDVQLALPEHFYVINGIVPAS